MSRRAKRLGLGVAIVVVGVALWLTFRPRDAERSVPLAFDGSSEQLPRTVVVPTLDSPIPDGKNVIWCASFQFAWNRLKDDLAGEPIRLENAQEIADRLNRSDQTESDVEAESVYAVAGFAKDGIADRIRTEMARRFPDRPPPDLRDLEPDGAVAYAFLAASSKFDTPYFENDKPLAFEDAEGKKTSVRSFGIIDTDPSGRLSRQVQILYSSRDEREGGATFGFAIDLCKTSEPYQIVLARVDRKATLVETLTDLERKIARFPSDQRTSRFASFDRLFVPNMAISVSHRFKELEGWDKGFLNPKLQDKNLYLDRAIQTIQFRLDRSGAELVSEAKIFDKVKAMPTVYAFNRPFLLYMKKRDGQRPFLVMWIENAELLQKW